MKFNCRASREAHISWREKYVEGMKQWHDWFAWYPVEAQDGYCYWLQRVQRRYPSAWFGSLYGSIFLENPEYRVKEPA